MELQIVKHDNWFRDFVTDMGRRGPSHLRDMPQHCPINNENNIFGKEFLLEPNDVDKSKPFAYVISVDGCDEELVVGGGEVLLEVLERDHRQAVERVALQPGAFDREADDAVVGVGVEVLVGDLGERGVADDDEIAGLHGGSPSLAKRHGFDNL